MSSLHRKIHRVVAPVTLQCFQWKTTKQTNGALRFISSSPVQMRLNPGATKTSRQLVRCIPRPRAMPLRAGDLHAAPSCPSSEWKYVTVAAPRRVSPVLQSVARARCGTHIAVHVSFLGTAEVSFLSATSFASRTPTRYRDRVAELSASSNHCTQLPGRRLQVSDKPRFTVNRFARSQKLWKRS